MNKIFISLFAVLFVPLSALTQDNQFSVEGHIASLTDAADVLLRYRVNTRERYDTAHVKKGYFVFSGKITTSVTADITVYPGGMDAVSTGPGVLGHTRRIWLEKGKIKIESAKSLLEATVRGTPLNEDQELYNALQKSHPAKSSTASEATVEFIRSHSNSMVSLMILSHGFGTPPDSDSGIPEVRIVEPLFESLSPAVRMSVEGKEYETRLQAWKKSGIGQHAAEFTQPDKDGKAIKLSDFKGKYVLLDFWASWCHPCRDENPNLRKQYELYKSQGFTILALSLDGGRMSTSSSQARNAWLKAIAQDSVGDFVHVCDLTGYSKNQPRIAYGVESIPENFLIDPSGKIIAKGLRGEKLNAKLKEIFGGAPQAGPSAVITFDASEPLVLDPAVRTGKLPNGFTYFIRQNKEPKDRVVLYLANKVGAILEEDNQKGLAHFLEHMNFNGTKHFPKNELVDYLQKSGVQFGADLNAYTSFDETVYQLPIPNDPAVLSNGIQIMRDWAQDALLDKKEIEKERGVVLEEKRTTLGAGERMRQQSMPVLFNHSRYAKRLPIGTDSVLKNFNRKALLDFYHAWYRPDLQALIVVGDIDVNEIEKVIRAKFADLKNPDNEKPRTKYTIPLTGQQQFIIVTDREQTQTSLQIISKHRERKIRIAEDYGNYLLQELFNTMLASRFSELSSNQSDPPFRQGGGGIASFYGGLDVFSASVVANPGQLERGFKATWREVERVKRYGFQSTELERAKKALISRIESALSESDKTSSSYFVNEYLNYFLKEVPAVSIAREKEMTVNFLTTVVPEKLHGITLKYITDIDQDIIVTGPEKDKDILPKEPMIRAWMQAVSNEDLKPYVDTFNSNNLLSSQPVAGKIVSEKKLSSIAATEWMLSNGARVILKPTNFSNNFVLFNASSPGGSSRYSDSDYYAAQNAAFLFSQSGLGNYNFSELRKFLSGKDLLFSSGVNDYHVDIQGGSSLQDMETFMQVLYAQFTQPRYDKAAFDGMISNFQSSLDNKSITPESIFQDSVAAILGNQNYRATPFSREKLAQIELDKSFKIYKELFSNASGFVFYVAGPFELEKLKPLVEKYLASLPSNGESTQPKNLGIHPPAGKISRTVYVGTESKAKVNLTFSNSYTYNAENNKMIEALKEVLQIRLLQRLREKESGTYSPKVFGLYQKVPEQRYTLRIVFDCDPKNVERLIAATQEEIELLKKNGPDITNVEKFKAEDRNNRALELNSDFAWVQYLKRQILNQEDLNEINQYDQIMQHITKETVQKAAQEYFKGDNFIRLVLMPKKNTQ